MVDTEEDTTIKETNPISNVITVVSMDISLTIVAKKSRPVINVITVNKMVIMLETVPMKELNNQDTKTIDSNSINHQIKTNQSIISKVVKSHSVFHH